MLMSIRDSKRLQVAGGTFQTYLTAQVLLGRSKWNWTKKHILQSLALAQKVCGIVGRAGGS